MEPLNIIQAWTSDLRGVLGGIRVTDGPKLLQIVSQGGSGYFFGQGAEKICIVRVSKGRTATGSKN